MKRVKNNIKLLGGAFIFICVSISLVGFSHSQGKSRLEKIQYWLDMGTSNGLDGIAVYIHHPELGEWTGVSGFANREKKQLITEQSIFYGASLSKTYVAVAMLKLVEQGKANLDAKVSEFLPPELAAELKGADEVTIRQLMNMTAGWADYSHDRNLNELYLTDKLSLDTLSHTEALQRYLAGKERLFEPGSQYYYSNSNYLILSMIMDQIYGDSHHQIITEYLRKGGYHDTYYKHKTIPRERLVNGYGDLDHDGEAEDITKKQWDTTWWLQGDDGIMGTPNDFGRFMKDLLTGKVLSESSLKEMTQWVMPDDPDYGLGLMYDEEPLYGKVAGHSGSAIGASCDVYYAFEKDITIAFMTNTGKRNGAPKFKEAYDYIFGKVVTELFKD